MSQLSHPTVPLKRLAQIRLGKMLQPKPRSSSDIELPYLRAGSLTTIDQFKELPTMWANQYEIDRHSLREGDLIVAEGGDVGATAFVPKLPSATIIQNSLHRIRPNGENDIRYLKYCLDSIRESGWLDVLCNRSTFGHLTSEKLGSLEIPYQPPPCQRATADYLDAETKHIDELIEKKQITVGLLEEHLDSLRTCMLLGTFDPVTGAGEPPPASRIGMLGVIVRLHRGFDLPQDDRLDGEIPVITSGGFNGYHSIPACEGPGVVTGRYGTVGEVFFVDGPYWPLNTTLFVSDFRENEPKWIYHLLKSLPLDIDSAKSAVTGVNRNIIGTLKIPVLPTRLQRTVAASLDSANSRVSAVRCRLEEQIELLLEHRQALITAAVTGKLDIPGTKP